MTCGFFANKWIRSGPRPVRFLRHLPFCGASITSRHEPGQPGKKVRMARELMAARKPLEALPLYAMLVQYMPDGYGEYGSVAAESGDMELANRLWDKHRAREAKNGAALALLAGECGKMGLNAKARTLWIEAANAEPRNLELQLTAAAFLARANEIEETRSLVQRCFELDPGNEQARYWTAFLDRRENKPCRG